MTTGEKTEVHVFVNKKKLELDTPTIVASALLDRAGFEGTKWDLLELRGEGDPTGGTLVQSDTVLTLKEGERFRVIPGDRTFGG